MLLRPVAQLYGQVRTDWNQCFVIQGVSQLLKQSDWAQIQDIK